VATEPQARFDFDVPLPRKVEEFDGETFIPKRDGERLTRLLDRVEAEMKSGKWYTYAALKKICGGSESGVAARIRDLRKEKFGGYTIESRHKGQGVWEYRLVQG
jgi:hypothetical protein